MILLGEISRYGSKKIYINTHEPFSIFLVGIQGSGKSHSLACILESCLLAPDEHKLIKLNQPLSTLVFHYDTNIGSICEVTGLTSPSSIDNLKKFNINHQKYHVERDNMIVLVSPSYYHQRKVFYGDHCKVAPLLLKWQSLTADHIKNLMGIGDGENQLYISTLLDMLRKYQRSKCLPTFSSFVAEIKEKCGLISQRGPLIQRLALLESIIAESDINKDLIVESYNLSIVTPGLLVIVDLTDPLLSKDEANSIFQVLTEQYRAIPSNISGGKLLALDEAHKFMDGTTGDKLSSAIVNCARTMRHDDMRLVISTQSPLSLAPELIELSSMAILHRFYSIDWFDYLSRKIPLSPEQKSTIVQLNPGNALIFSPRHRLSAYSDNRNFFEVAIRNRLTEDYGASKTNAIIDQITI